MGRFPKFWWLAALLVTSACNLNPRPEDPGAASDKGGFTGGAGGGAGSVPPVPVGEHVADAGASTGIPGRPNDPGRASDAGAPSDASASDAGTESGPAAPDAPLP